MKNDDTNRDSTDTPAEPSGSKATHEQSSVEKEHGALDSLREASRSLAAKAKTAGIIAAKEAEIARIKSSALPTAYYKLGRWVLETGFNQEKLASSFEPIAAIDQEIQSLSDAAGQQPKAEGFAAKAKALAKSGADAAQVKVLQAKRQKALYQLGKVAFDKCSKDKMPELLINDISTRIAQIEELEHEITKLNQDGSSLFTPKRVAILCASVTAILLFSFLIGMLRSPSGAQIDPVASHLDEVLKSSNKEMSMATGKVRSLDASVAQRQERAANVSERPNTAVADSTNTRSNLQIDNGTRAHVERADNNSKKDQEKEFSAEAIQLALYFTGDGLAELDESWNQEKIFSFSRHSVSGEVFLLPNDKFMYCADGFPPSIYDITTAKLLKRFDRFISVEDASISHGAQCILWASGYSRREGRRFHMWNFAEEKMECQLQLASPKSSDMSGEEGVLSPDEKLIATADAGQVRVWSVTTRETLFETEGSYPLAFSPDGTQLAFGHHEEAKGCVVWDYRGNKKAILRRPDIDEDWDTVEALVFIPNTPLLAVLSSYTDHLVELWNSKTHELVAVLEARIENVRKSNYALAVSSDGTFIVAGGKGVQVWHLPSGGRMGTLGLGDAQGYVRSISISPDSERIAAVTADRTITIWTRKPDLSGQFAYSDLPRLTAGDPVVPDVRGPNGEQVRVGGDGPGTKWYFHYYMDKAGKKVMHGEAKAPVNATGEQVSHYEQGVLIDRTWFDSEQRVVESLKRRSDGSYERLQSPKGTNVVVQSVVSMEATKTGEKYSGLSMPRIVSHEGGAASLTREEVLKALKVMGAEVGENRITENGILKQACILRATIEQLTALLGKPEMLSDRYDSFLDADYQRWRFQCEDGPLTFHGNTLPGNTPPLQGSLQLQSIKACFY